MTRPSSRAAFKRSSSEVVATCKTLQSRAPLTRVIALNHPALAPGCLFIGSLSDVPGNLVDSNFSTLNLADCQPLSFFHLYQATARSGKLHCAVFWCMGLWKTPSHVSTTAVAGAPTWPTSPAPGTTEDVKTRTKSRSRKTRGCPTCYRRWVLLIVLP